MSACKTTNELPLEDNLGEGLWDTPFDLSGKTYTVIKVYKDGTGEHKDKVKDGFAHLKRQCLHCIDPSCVSVCPVHAMTKDAVTGVVSYNPDACIGCRYCVAACPYRVPQFQYDTPFPRIAKCQFCKQHTGERRHSRLRQGLPDRRDAVRQLQGPDRRNRAAESHEARRAERLPKAHGRFGRHRKSGRRRIHRSGLYGAKALGGTQVRYLSGVPFDKFGLPVGLPELSYAAVSETLQQTLYGGLARSCRGARRSGCRCLPRCQKHSRGEEDRHE